VTEGDLSARVQIGASDPEVDRLGREINEMVARLAELLASQQRFVAHAAHELRTPLAALYGELQQARRKGRDNAYYAQAIDAALDAARHLNLLAEDLLTLARVRASTNEECQPLPAGRVIDEARVLVEPLVRDRGIQIGAGGDLDQVIMDRKGDTIRLLRNLLENAARYSPRRGAVSVAVVREQGNVVIRVLDCGPGVAAADRDAIFEPFFRARGAAVSEGAGLGLGIAREIARSHGGDVWLETSRNVGTGACFVVRIPVAPTGGGHARPALE
jgi:two-component system heavy metal sensor histidine kinase CusS